MLAKSDFKKIVISTISRLSYQFASILTLLFLTPFMIKNIGDYNYGIWVLVTIFVNYLGYTELGVSSAIERNLAVAIGDKNKEEFNKVHNNGLFLNFIILFLVLIITFLIIAAITLIHFKEYKLVSILILIMGINLALCFPFKSFISIISANIRFEIISSIMSIQLLINSLMIFVLLSKGYGLISLALATLTATFFSNLLYFIFAIKLFDFLPFDFSLINKDTIKKLLGFSRKTFIVQIADILRSKLDEMVIGTFISVKMVTTYSIANKLNSSANNFSLSFLGILNPLFSKYINIKSNDERVKLFFLISKPVILLSSLVFFGFLFLGYPFIKIWMGVHYLKAYYPLILLAAGYFIALSQSVGVNYMFSTNTHQYFAYISILEGVSNLIFSLVFVIYFKMGIIGVALGTFVSIFLVKTFVQPFVVSKILQIKVSEYYYFFIKNISIGLILYSLAGLLVLQINIDGYLKIFGIALCFVLIALIHFTFMLNNEEKSLIREKIILPYLKDFFIIGNNR
ncbi:MAG: oligosaccharide flippase family protein [bacterium]